MKRSNQSTFSDSHYHQKPLQYNQQQKSSSSSDQQQQRDTVSQEDRLETLRRLSIATGLDTKSLMIEFARIGKLPPPWSATIEHRYGTKIPRIFGLADDFKRQQDTQQQPDQCQRFRQMIPPNKRWVAPAGLFHSGTNLMGNLLSETCHWEVQADSTHNYSSNSNTDTVGHRKPHWQVVYGKHNPIQAATEDSYRIPRYPYNSTNEVPLENVMAIVMVRHPLDWIRSVCKQPFAISWGNNINNTAADDLHQQQHRRLPCPSLDSDVYVNAYKQLHFSNLLDLWNVWNRDYYNYDQSSKKLGGRIIVRLEDLAFAPKDTLSKICECVGGIFEFDPQRILRERQGGTARDESSDTRQSSSRFKSPFKMESTKPNFLVEAWGRHADVDMSTSILSSENRILFRKQMEDIGDMLEVFHYRVE
jgi:hypothetical protein